MKRLAITAALVCAALSAHASNRPWKPPHPVVVLHLPPGLIIQRQPTPEEARAAREMVYQSNSSWVDNSYLRHSASLVLLHNSVVHAAPMNATVRQSPCNCTVRHQPRQ